MMDALEERQVVSRESMRIYLSRIDFQPGHKHFTNVQIKLTG